MPLLIIGAGIFVRLIFSMTSSHRIDFTDVSAIALNPLPWAFFVSAIKFGTNSMVSNANLVTKIYFPREVFPLAAVLVSLFDGVIASSVIVVLLILGKVGIRST